MNMDYMSAQFWESLPDESKTTECIKTAGNPDMDVGINRVPFPVRSSAADCEAWSEFLKTITLNGPILCRFDAYYNWRTRETVVAMIMKTIHRDSAKAPWWHEASDGEPRRMISEPRSMNIKTFTATAARIIIETQPPTRQPIDDHSLRWVRALAREGWLHELDELLMVGDQRPFDPHRDDDKL